MNIKNLIMWVIIVLLSVGLFNMFQDPSKNNSQNNSLPFSEFLNEVEDGRVVEVKIQGNNINGLLSNGDKFKTYSPNYPPFLNKLSDKEFLERKLQKAHVYIKSRGPDERGLWHDQNSYFLHSRLKIIDLNRTSSQPMVLGDHVITYNG